MARQKCLYLHHQGEFQHNYYTFVSLHDSDHNGVVRIFVGHSSVLWGLIIYLVTRHNFPPTRNVIAIYAAQFFLYQECKLDTWHNFSPTRNITRGNRTPGSCCNLLQPVATCCNSLAGSTSYRYCSSFQLTQVSNGSYKGKARNYYSTHNFTSMMNFGM